jgi:hexosaminidase
MTRSNQNIQSSEPEVVAMPCLKSKNVPFFAQCIALAVFVPLLGFPSLALSQVHLLPAPREAHFTGETPLPERLFVDVIGHDPEDEFAARDLEEAAKQPAMPVHTGPRGYRVALMRASSAEAKALLASHHLAFDAAMADEGYVIIVEASEAHVIAASGAGVFYGVQTFKQLLPLAGAKSVLPTGTVRDWPAMKYRGIQDDLSRGPVPTLEFQKHQMRVFAAYKANIYSPYFEHTLLYPDHPLPAPLGGAMTPADVAELVKYAHQYHITIVPEQEAFGHLHHVLKYDLYKDVAETPHGHVLAPGQPGSLPLIKDWFTDIAKEFPSPFLHIGADETNDLGKGLTAQQVKERGYGPVYVDFLKQIHDELAPLHRRLVFWGDIGGDDPKAVPGLPKDMIAVPWNYDALKSFDSMIEPFQKAGIETWIGDGDANWGEVYPQAKTAFGNIQGFVRDGQRLGSTGSITTVWDDDGEGLFNMNWYTVLFGAVAAWQPGESSISDYQDAFGSIFHGDSSGKIDQAEKEMMAAFDVLSQAKIDTRSDDIVWLDPWSAQGQAVSAKLLPLAPEMRRHAEQAIVLVTQARMANPDLREADALTALDLGARRLDLIGMKFELSQEIADAYTQAFARPHDKEHDGETQNILDEVAGDNGRCEDLRDAYSAIKAEYSQLWLGENRPWWLNNVTVRYDLAIEEWQRRGVLIQAANSDFQNGKPLPTASTLGIPAPIASK